MTTYGDWSIGGNTPSHIIAAGYDMAQRQIKLQCLAETQTVVEDDGSTRETDPREEIQVYVDMACDVITNTQLIGGGSSLQVLNGELTLISDGINAWVGALYQPVIIEDNYAHKSIEYELIIAVETLSRGGLNDIPIPLDPDDPDPDPDDPVTPPVVPVISYRYGYLTGFNNYTNINYKEFTADPPPGIIGSTDDYFYGTSFGRMVITETKLVRKVVLVGTSDFLPAWVEVNGNRQNVSRVGPNLSPEIRDGYTGGPWKEDILVFELSTPSKTITITTSKYEWEDPDGPAGGKTPALHHGFRGTVEVFYV